MQDNNLLPVRTEAITNTKALGLMVRQRRQAMGLGLEEAAAWCNVGVRFLFEVENGKSTVQFAKALEVAGRFDIRLCLVAGGPALPVGGGVKAAGTDEAPVVLTAPAHDVGHWLGSRIVAGITAHRCGVELWGHQGDKNKDRLYATLPPGSRPLLGTPGAVKKEDQGGPGFSAIFAELDRQSSQPIIDIRKAIEWAVFSFMIGDTNVSAGDLRMIDQNSGSRLAPFAVLACSPALVAEERAHGGLRIGREWPSEWMRADPWLLFAKDARVQPKLVFGIMQEMASAVPAAVNAAALEYYKTSVLRGAPAIMVKTAITRATRVKDLLLAARYQGVTGMPKAVKEPAPQVDEAPYLGHETVYE